MTVIRSRPLLAALLLAAAFLAGCAQVPRQAYNAAAASHVKTVVLVRAENQTEYAANMLGHPGMSFGLIGGLIAAADIQSKTNRLTTALQPQETRLQERFAEKLTERLKASGYEAKVVVLPKDTRPDQALGAARGLATGGDAFVLVDLQGGYWTAGPSTDYLPRLTAKLKTVETKTEKVLYEDTITYGYATPQLETVHLASEPAYRFNTIELLVADPVKARQGLYTGLDAVADQVAKDLKRP
jgi:hypothetical protein